MRPALLGSPLLARRADPCPLSARAVEAAVVSYCTQKGHGGRTIKAGAITGVQVLKTEACVPSLLPLSSRSQGPNSSCATCRYIQWTGFIDQTALHLTADDSGGELGASSSFLSFLPRSY